MFMNIFLVALGGALGSILRYLCVTGFRFPLWPGFPWGTLFVNVIGCFVIGFVGGLAANKQFLSESGRIFLFTGILGGFTTFSAFGLETYFLMRTSQWFLALSNIFLQLNLGLGAVIFGHWLAKHL
jgi:fluoride exporter